jgi:hypothetical protein
MLKGKERAAKKAVRNLVNLCRSMSHGARASRFQAAEVKFRAPRFVRVAIPSAIRNPLLIREGGWLHPTLRLKEATSGVKKARTLGVSHFLTVANVDGTQWVVGVAG